MKKIAIIQARTGSSRLHNKVLKEIEGKAVLGHVIDRVKKIQNIEDIIVATTEGKKDDVICEYSKLSGVNFVRGSEDDVLGRFVKAASRYKEGIVLRINSDCPFVDPFYCSELIDFVENEKCDYSSYCFSDGTPVVLSGLGFFAEAVKISCLNKAHYVIDNAFDREHVTLGIYKRPSIFSVKYIKLPFLYDRKDIRLTLDTENDFDIISTVFKYADNIQSMSAKKIVDFVTNNKKIMMRMMKEIKNNPKSTNNILN